MTRPHIAMLCAAMTIASGACACAATAQADGPPSGGTTTAELGGPTLFSRPGELLGRVLRFRGSVPAAQAGRAVLVQRLGSDGSWVLTAEAVTGADGSFLARWRTDELGRFTVRAVVAGGEAQVAAAPPTTRVTVYRPAHATWYGPGFYGKRTACGLRLTRRLLGVAHRTLPCGTPVEIYLNGNAITVPVVDRGPFGSRARYDLTSAAAQQLGMTVTTLVGVAPQRGARLPAAAAPPAPAPAYAATGGTAFASS